MTTTGPHKSLQVTGVGRTAAGVAVILVVLGIVLGIAMLVRA